MTINNKRINSIADNPLSEEEMESVMTAIMEGEVNDDEIAAFLTGLADRGPSANEVTGAARVLRQKAETIDAPKNAVDCCGTGGDGLSTYNVSTAVALITAACGVPVAKHGNRAVSSKAGAADTLEALGVNLDISHKVAETALKKLNFAFLMAPRHHKAMKHVARVRKSLGFRTIFNILGPLANPANTKRQLIGVYDQTLLPLMAEVLDRLGTEKAWVVHGHDGLDEITITGPSFVETLENGKRMRFKLDPKEYGMPYRALESIRGGDAEHNAAALALLLEGETSGYRDIALLNAAPVLLISGTVNTLEDGLEMAANAIDSGKAKEVLESYIAFTQQNTGAAA